MKNFIYITTSFEGFHKYIEAPDEVKFLRHSHRHIFYIKVYIEVFHDDRDIEFILFKRFINRLIEQYDFNNKSCEQISYELFKLISMLYKEREIWIDISEDNENGSFKQYLIQ